MTILQAIVLGIVQGITEFFPISSSGHLVIIPHILGWPDQGLAFDVALHAGSLSALIICFRRDLLNIIKAWFVTSPEQKEHRRLSIYVVIATIPVVVAGLILEPFIDSVFRDLRWVGFWLLLVGIVILTTQKFISRLEKSEIITKKHALGVGMAQVLALFPGVSRSGITIWTGTLLGLTHEKAARFSFLIGMLAITGATAKQALDIATGKELLGENTATLIIGFLTSALVSFLAIAGLLYILKKYTLRPFAVYMICLGAIIILFL